MNNNYYIHSFTGEKGLIVSSDDKGVILYIKDKGTKFNTSVEILNKFWIPITEDEYRDTNFGLQDTIKRGHDNVNHPSHYNQGNIECIDALIAAHGKQAVADFCLCNAHKYVWRTLDKNGKEDCDKAIWYLNKYKELKYEKEE